MIGHVSKVSFDDFQERLAALGSGEPSEDALSGIARPIDLWLHEVLPDHLAADGCWTDGSTVESATHNASRIVLDGVTSYSDHSDFFYAPLQIEAQLDPQSGDLQRVSLRLGDGSASSLKDHRGDLKRARQRPDTWLVDFDIRRALPLVVDSVLSSLTTWVSSNQGAKIVDGDWNEVTLEQALRLVRDGAARGHRAELANTWLEGASALRVLLGES